MALWADIEHAVGTPISFADPHAPWQRPVNENCNGLLRRWLAKSTDLSISTQTDLDAIAQPINHMPRRSQNSGHTHRHYDDALVATTG
jgi:IS30 family transposase